MLTHEYEQRERALGRFECGYGRARETDGAPREARRWERTENTSLRLVETQSSLDWCDWKQIKRCKDVEQRYSAETNKNVDSIGVCVVGSNVCDSPQRAQRTHTHRTQQQSARRPAPTFLFSFCWRLCYLIFPVSCGETNRIGARLCSLTFAEHKCGALCAFECRTEEWRAADREGTKTVNKSYDCAPHTHQRPWNQFHADVCARERERDEETENDYKMDSCFSFIWFCVRLFRSVDNVCDCMDYQTSSGLSSCYCFASFLLRCTAIDAHLFSTNVMLCNAPREKRRKSAHGIGLLGTQLIRLVVVRVHVSSQRAADNYILLFRLFLFRGDVDVRPIGFALERFKSLTFSIQIEINSSECKQTLNQMKHFILELLINNWMNDERIRHGQRRRETKRNDFLVYGAQTTELIFRFISDRISCARSWRSTLSLEEKIAQLFRRRLRRLSAELYFEQRSVPPPSSSFCSLRRLARAAVDSLFSDFSAASDDRSGLDVLGFTCCCERTSHVKIRPENRSATQLTFFSFFLGFFSYSCES